MALTERQQSGEDDSQTGGQRRDGGWKGRELPGLLVTNGSRK